MDMEEKCTFVRYSNLFPIHYSATMLRLQRRFIIYSGRRSHVVHPIAKHVPKHS